MKKILSIIVFLLISCCIYAQSADVITKILKSDEVSYGEVCYLSAVRQNLISESASYNEAIDVLYENGQIPERLSAKDSAYLMNLSYIYSRIWPNLSGSLMYKLTKGSPRYTFKLFKADGVLGERADPYDKVSGFEALSILTSCMIEYGSEEECMSMDVIEDEIPPAPQEETSDILGDKVWFR